MSRKVEGFGPMAGALPSWRACLFGFSALDLERRARPFENRTRRRAAAADDVEPARHRGEYGIALQIDRRRAGEFRLLAGTNRYGAAAVRVVATIAHFDECDLIAVAHDQVDLAVAAGEIARDQRKACALQMGKHGVFPARAGVARGRVGAARMLPVSG